MFDKENLTNAVVILVSLCVAVIISELILQLFFKPEPIIYKDFSVVGQRPVSGDRDSDGWRNTSVPETVEIVTIGDSQTEGLNATREEAWPQVLAELTGSTTYQMGYGGSGVAHYRYLLDQALAKNPEHIIIGLYLGNDLYDTFATVYTNDYFTQYRDPLIVSQVQENLIDSLSQELYTTLKTGNVDTDLRLSKKIRLWFRNHSEIYRLLGNASRALREQLGLAESEEERYAKLITLAKTNPEQAFVFTDAEIGTVLSPTYRRSAIDLSGIAAQEGIRITNQMLWEIKSTLETEAIDLSIIVIPTKEAVYGDYFASTDTPITSELHNIITQEAQVTQILLTICDLLTITCHTVKSDLANALLAREKIYPDSINGHPTASGYQVIAKSVADFLQSVNRDQ